MSDVRIVPRALVVEDEILVAMVAEDILGSIGFDPLCVETAAGALDALAHGGFSLAVIDVGLPDMRGDDLAAKVRELAPHMPVVLASGYDATELARRFSHDRGVSVLAKPYTEEELRAAIASSGLLEVEG